VPAYTLRQLECFVTIAEEGSIQAAASRLYASASALSSALNTLETALDTQLAIRQKAHGVTLTPAGNFILRRARNLLQDAEELAPRQAETEQRSKAPSRWAVTLPWPPHC
jgi:DNA-binding transcriptional LysR family regulator